MLTLITGDAYPERKDKSLLRVIGHKSCPYVERVLLVLEAKGIDYETVNVRLQDKHEFLADKKLPVIEFDGDDKVLSESLIIIDYIEEVYADKGRRLAATDAYTKAQHKLFVELFSRWHSSYYKTFLSTDDPKTIWDTINDIFKTVEKFFASHRKGKFLSGDDKPGLIDYVLWPFIERFPVAIAIFTNHDYNDFIAKELPTVSDYRNEMLKDSAVAKIAYSVEIHQRFTERCRNQIINANLKCSTKL